MIKYFVRTTGEREFNYSPLQYEVLIDKHHNARKHYIESLEIIKEYDSVLLEDDVVLCKNFQHEIEKVIYQYPNSIINFFTSPKYYYTTHYTMGFSFNQCTYYPIGILDDLLPVMRKIASKDESKFYGTILNQALNEIGIPHLVYRPCLVQHIDSESLLCEGKTFARNTIYFKDYLDELKIDYSDAYKTENRERLTELREQDRKKWRGE